MEKCVSCSKTIEGKLDSYFCKKCSIQNAMPYFTVAGAFVLLTTVGLYAIG